MTGRALSGIWGVGRYVDGRGRPHAWPVGTEEMERDRVVADRWLDAVGLGRGDRCCVASMLSEAAQTWPLVVAALLRGVQLSFTDATAAEAPRLHLLLRTLAHDAVVGVTDELVGGLGALGAMDHLLAVPVVAARPGAWAALGAAGRVVHRMALVGPALALGREPGGPATCDPGEWALGTDGGQVTVTSLAPRCHPVRNLATAIRGRVVDGNGVVPEPIGPDLIRPEVVG